MTKVTKKGRELADKLNPSMGTSETILKTCSLICRHATTHGHIQEIFCSVSLPETRQRWFEHREAWLEARITALVGQLPTVDGEFIRPKFGGDPRGYTVKLVMPDGRYDTWGGPEEGLGVPQN